jgi:hypothetical protein
MTSTERTYTLELTGKELEMLSLSFGLAMAAIMGDVEAGGLGLAMIKMRGDEGWDVLISAGIKFGEVSDAIPENEWSSRRSVRAHEEPLMPDETGLEPPSPFPMRHAGEVC